MYFYQTNEPLQEGYVFGNIGLFVCLWTTLLKKL